MFRSLVITVFVAGIALTSPASAQSRRELAERIDVLEARLVQMEERFMAGDPVAETLMERADALDYQVRELTSEVERLSFENRRMRSQIEDMGLDLEDVLNRAYSGEAMVDPSAGPGNLEPSAFDSAAADAMAETAPERMDEVPSDVDEARTAATGTLGAGIVEMRSREAVNLYNAGQDRLRDGDLIGARDNFAAFVAENPDDPMAGEALFWIGRTHLVDGAYPEAADAFIASLRAQPEGDRAPEALVYLANALDGMGQREQACGALAQFGSQFPDAPEAARITAGRQASRLNCN